jgi:hypothetical protein
VLTRLSAFSKALLSVGKPPNDPVAELQADHLDFGYLRYWANELGMADLAERLLAEVRLKDETARPHRFSRYTPQPRFGFGGLCAGGGCSAGWSGVMSEYCGSTATLTRCLCVSMADADTLTAGGTGHNAREHDTGERRDAGAENGGDGASPDRTAARRPVKGWLSWLRWQILAVFEFTECLIAMARWQMAANGATLAGSPGASCHQRREPRPRPPHVRPWATWAGMARTWRIAARRLSSGASRWSDACPAHDTPPGVLVGLPFSLHGCPGYVSSPFVLADEPVYFAVGHNPDGRWYFRNSNLSVVAHEYDEV